MSDYDITPNLNLLKPHYNADLNAWGGHLNANMDTLDAVVAGVRDSGTGVASSLTPAATAGSYVQAMLASFSSPPPGLQILQVIGDASGDINYTLELFDGPSGSPLVYQATGITAPSYVDNSSFYASPLLSGQLWGRVTTIDSALVTVTITVRFLQVR